ncbi:ABC transporter permease [Staphylococcus schleiferi]|uniref:ABC transporter permease n=1 Tax=Staphylococcus coagulans TaxID=74706 RepID=UPI0006BDDADC|nr:ABC transporter permease [Staphylococcus coagulans]BAS44933.1 ABC transporter permease [Staphylococcus schleiferi]
MMRFAYLLSELRLLFRFKTRLILSIFIPLAFYLLFTSIIQAPEAEMAEINKNAMYSMTTFSLTSFCLFSFPLELIDERKKGWYKNLMTTPLKPFDYFSVKIIKTMFQFVLAIFIIFGTAAFYKGVHLSLSQWILSGVVLWIGASLFLSLGVLLAQINDTQKASGIGNILYLGLAVLGGLWFPIDTFPSFMKPIAHLTPTYHLKKLATDLGQNDSFAISAFIILLLYSMIFLSIALYIQKRRDVSQ